MGSEFVLGPPDAADRVRHELEALRSLLADQHSTGSSGARGMIRRVWSILASTERQQRERERQALVECDYELSEPVAQIGNFDETNRLIADLLEKFDTLVTIHTHPSEPPGASAATQSGDELLTLLAKTTPADESQTAILSLRIYGAALRVAHLQKQRRESIAAFVDQLSKNGPESLVAQTRICRLRLEHLPRGPALEPLNGFTGLLVVRNPYDEERAFFTELVLWLEERSKAVGGKARVGIKSTVELREEAERTAIVRELESSGSSLASRPAGPKAGSVEGVKGRKQDTSSNES